MYFPGEDNNMKRKNRNVSYRNAYGITGEIEFQDGEYKNIICVCRWNVDWLDC